MNSRAKAYGNLNSSRNATKGNYGIRTHPSKVTATESRLPTAKEPEPAKPTKAPTYQFVDGQKGQTDTNAEQHGETDDKIREEAGKSKESEEQATNKFVPPSHKAEGKNTSDQPSTETTAFGSNDFQAYWALETGYDLEEEIFEEANTWTPNSFAMFEILNQMQEFVVDNRVVIKHHPEYLDYAVACYYSMLFFIQILRAREAAGQLTGEERSFLKRFRASYPEESLVVAGPLVPYFSTITSTLLPDNRYNWIVPTIATGLTETLTTTTTGSGRTLKETNVFHDADGSIYLQPMFPYMISILRFATDKYMATHLSDALTSDPQESRFFNEDGLWIAGNCIDAQTLFGFNFHIGTDTAAPYHIFNTQGLHYPFHAQVDQMDVIHNKWKSSAFNKGITICCSPDTSNTETMTEKNTKGLDNFLCSPKSKNLDWFRSLLNQAVTQARFIKNVSNLSRINPTSGQEPLIVAKFSRMVNRNTKHAAFTSLKVDADKDNFTWYPATWNDLTAEFETTRSGIKREESLQAICFGINASLPFNVKVGTAKGSPHSQGAYWDDETWTATMFKDSRRGKPMFKGWKTMYQTRYLADKPPMY